MKKLTNILMGAVKHYTTFDFATFKIYMVLIGILIGVYFAPFFEQHLPILWCVAVVAAIIVIVQLIRYAVIKKE